MPELITIYWRDIPSQVTAKAGRKTAKVMLPDRFQHAIDRAAMRAGKGSSDAYMEDWRRDRTRCSSELQSVAEDQAAALIAQFNDRYLEALVKAKGVADQVAPDIQPGPEPAAEDSDDHVDSNKPDDAVGVERPG